MSKYNTLLNKKINVEFNGTILNSYYIKKMRPTDRYVTGYESRGIIHNCDVDWEITGVAGAIPVMDFEEQTLDDLMNNGFSVCPTLPNLIYRLDNKKSQSELWNKSN